MNGYMNMIDEYIDMIIDLYMDGCIWEIVIDR